MINYFKPPVLLTFAMDFSRWLPTDKVAILTFQKQLLTQNKIEVVRTEFTLRKIRLKKPATLPPLFSKWPVYMKGEVRLTGSFDYRNFCQKSS